MPCWHLGPYIQGGNIQSSYLISPLMMMWMMAMMMMIEKKKQNRMPLVALYDRIIETTLTSCIRQNYVE